jgi:hypothetical protein
MSDDPIIRNVVARYLKAKGKPEWEVRVQVTEAATDTLTKLLTRIHHHGRGGHSFGIQSDDGEKLGGWDGDGADYIIGVEVINLETDEKKRIDIGGS